MSVRYNGIKNYLTFIPDETITSEKSSTLSAMLGGTYMLSPAVRVF
jgi:hypothetical protein